MKNPNTVERQEIKGVFSLRAPIPTSLPFIAAEHTSANPFKQFSF